jgi:hypothetical protein
MNRLSDETSRLIRTLEEFDAASDRNIEAFQNWLSTVCNPSSEYYDEMKASLFANIIKDINGKISLIGEVHVSYLRVFTHTFFYFGLCLKSTEDSDGCLPCNQETVDDYRNLSFLKMPQELLSKNRGQLEMICTRYIINCCEIMSLLGYKALVYSVANRFYSLAVENGVSIGSNELIEFYSEIINVIMQPSLSRAADGKIRITSNKEVPAIFLNYVHRGIKCSAGKCNCFLLPRFFNNGIDKFLGCASPISCGFFQRIE